MNFDFLPESARNAGLGPLMKGVGAVARRLPIPQPTLLVGAGASRRLGQAVAAFGHKRVLVVTDKVIAGLGLHQPLIDALQAGGATVAVFDEITPDAPIPLIERGIAAYRTHDADTMVAIGGGVQQISVMLDVVWASLLPVGTISALYYADRIAQLPLGVVGIAVGTALLPLLARELRAGNAPAAMANQNRAIEFGLLFSLPAAVALWLLADPIIRTLFERGRFGPEDTWRAAGALAAFAAGLPAFVLVKALTPGFFAREDTRTPLYVAVAAIATNIALNLLFLFATTLAHVGIALASSLSGWLNAALLAAVLLKRRHWVPDTRLVSRAVRVVGATLGMGAALWGMTIWLAAPLARPDISGGMALAATCAAGVAAYALLGVALGIVQPSELRYALRRQPGLKSADPGEPP